MPKGLRPGRRFERLAGSGVRVVDLKRPKRRPKKSKRPSREILAEPRTV